MGTSSRLATQLDAEMLAAVKVRIEPPSTPDAGLPSVTGTAFAQQVSRLLVRYLRKHQVGQLTRGSDRPQWVTLTPYTSEEAISWLALPAPLAPPGYALLLDPAKMPDYEIAGPRWVRGGGGVEYLLRHGFPPAAIAAPGWEVEVR